MPLSGLGISQIDAATETLDIPLSVIDATDLHVSQRPLPVEELRRALVEAGASIHYPAVVVLVDGNPRGPAIVGYRRADAYRELLSRRLSAGESEVASDEWPPARVPDEIQPMPDARVRTIWKRRVEPRPGAFFRHVSGTSYIAFDQGREVHLLDLTTGDRFRGPGWIDFVPTPDGRLFVTPSADDKRLEFYLAADVFRRGRGGTASGLAPVFADPALNDQYPSVGVLESDPDSGRTIYRVLVSWTKGVAMRDYEVRWVEDGSPSIVPITPKRTPCSGRNLSTPMLSKNGWEIVARDEDTGTTKLFELDADGDCEELFDLGLKTSKVAFSDDGLMIAFSSPTKPDSLPHSQTYVLDRRDMSITPLDDTGSFGLVIPDFVGDDGLLVAIATAASSESVEFRLLCCLPRTVERP